MCENEVEYMVSLLTRRRDTIFRGLNISEAYERVQYILSASNDDYDEDK